MSFILKNGIVHGTINYIQKYFFPCSDKYYKFYFTMINTRQVNICFYHISKSLGTETDFSVSRAENLQNLIKF